MDCYECIYIKESFAKKPDCIKCGRIHLLPENFLCVGLIEHYSGIILDSSGSIQAEGLKMALEMENIDLDKTILEKIIIFVNNARMTQRSKPDGKTN